MDKHDEIKNLAFNILSEAVTTNYSKYILDKILVDIIEDVETSADEHDWNEDDVRLAIGRSILKKFGEEI